MDTRRIATIEGRRTVVVERTPPLQASLEALRRAMVVMYFEEPIRPALGASRQCTELREHRLVRFLEGRHLGTDGQVRDLRLTVCRDCHAVCVRDVSMDTTTEFLTGRAERVPTAAAPRRRDLVLGWYSGSRPNQREYR